MDHFSWGSLNQKQCCLHPNLGYAWISCKDSIRLCANVAHGTIRNYAYAKLLRERWLYWGFINGGSPKMEDLWWEILLNWMRTGVPPHLGKPIQCINNQIFKDVSCPSLHNPVDAFLAERVPASQQPLGPGPTTSCVCQRLQVMYRFLNFSSVRVIAPASLDVWLQSAKIVRRSSRRLYL
jgi:hypothetical protein